MSRVDAADPGSRHQRGRAGLIVVVCLALVLAVGGAAAHQLGLLGELFDTATEPGPSPRRQPAGPSPRLLEPVAAPPVLNRAVKAPIAQPTKVAAQLAPLLAAPDLGSHLGLAVEDLTRSRRLLRAGEPGPFVPASLTKLFTAAAALRVLGPSHRFETKVVAVPGSRRITLVGGGDPLLTRRVAPPGTNADRYPRAASLAGLAARTARALRVDGVEEVRLSLDASLFPGSTVSRHWRRSYVDDDVVSPITALWVDGGRLRPGLARRSTDPVRAAGLSFARELRRRGVDVELSERHVEAPPEAVRIAAVRSAPLAQIGEQVLGLSDNEAAEVVLRHVALARGRPATFRGGVRAEVDVLRRLGVDLTGVRLFDGSGLARDNQVSLGAVLDVISLAADPSHPELRPLLAELPVAGFTGSLAYRFTDQRSAEGRGYVRAKTGTLTGVHGVAGTVTDRDGNVLAYVAIADEVRRIDTLDARQSLDRIGAALAACGCAKTPRLER